MAEPAGCTVRVNCAGWETEVHTLAELASRAAGGSESHLALALAADGFALIPRSSRRAAIELIDALRVYGVDARMESADVRESLARPASSTSSQSVPIESPLDAMQTGSAAWDGVRVGTRGQETRPAEVSESREEASGSRLWVQPNEPPVSPLPEPPVASPPTAGSAASGALEGARTDAATAGGWAAVLGGKLHEDGAAVRLADGQLGGVARARPGTGGEGGVAWPGTGAGEAGESTPAGTAGASALPRAAVWKGDEGKVPAAGLQAFGQAEPVSLLADRAGDARRRVAGHSPLVALLLALIAPGAGQAYNGEPGRGITFALSSVFAVPWLVSLFDAPIRAAQIRRGVRLMEERRRPAYVVAFIGIFWGVVAGAWFGFEQLREWVAPRVIAFAEMSLEGDAVDTVPPNGFTGGSEASPPDGGATARTSHDEQRRQFDCRVLIARARRACNRGRFEECLALAEEALQIDETNTDAHRVYIEARGGLGFSPGSGTGSGSIEQAPP